MKPSAIGQAWPTSRSLEASKPNPMDILESRLASTILEKGMLSPATLVLIDNRGRTPSICPFIDIICTLSTPSIGLNVDELIYINYLDRSRFEYVDRGNPLTPHSMERVRGYLELCRLTNVEIIQGTGRMRLKYMYFYEA